MISASIVVIIWSLSRHGHLIFRRLDNWIRNVNLVRASGSIKWAGIVLTACRVIIRLVYVPWNWACLMGRTCLTILFIEWMIVLGHFLVEFLICKMIRAPCILDHWSHSISNQPFYWVKIVQNKLCHWFKVFLLHLYSWKLRRIFWELISFRAYFLWFQH